MVLSLKFLVLFLDRSQLLLQFPYSIVVSDLLGLAGDCYELTQIIIGGLLVLHLLKKCWVWVLYFCYNYFKENFYPYMHLIRKSLSNYIPQNHNYTLQRLQVHNQIYSYIFSIHSSIMNRWRKLFYVAFTGCLTSIAMTACYWQSNKYLDSRKRWNLIAKQLSSSKPVNISSLNPQEKDSLYAFKYIEIDGKLSDQYFIVSRPRGMRTGYLVLKKITYKDDKTGNIHEMVALDGWCPEKWQLQNISTLEQSYQGILRKKQSKDYLHTKLTQSDLQKFNMNTWIDLDKYLSLLNINPDKINTQFYFEILKPLETQKPSQISQTVTTEQGDYPYRYRVDNFELPYLTPDKHWGYATFWFCTSLVGLGAIGKVLRMK